MGSMSDRLNGLEFSPQLFDSWAHSYFLRVTTSLFFLGLMVKAYLERYGLLFERHNFMTGIDYVGENVKLPLLLMAIVGFFIIAVGNFFIRPRPMRNGAFKQSDVLKCVTKQLLEICQSFCHKTLSLRILCKKLKPDARIFASDFLK